MKILIVGGGIAGLALAHLLEQQKHQITLIERAHQFKTMGFGVSLWPAGQKILEQLGVMEDVKKKSYSLHGYTITDQKGKPVHQLNFKHFFKTYGHILGIERSALHQILIKLCHHIPIHFSTTITQLKQTAQAVHVVFNDGSEDTFDLVVGADGIRSSVRQLIFPQVKPQPYGWTSWLFWLPARFHTPNHIYQMIGPKAYFTLYPLHENKCCVYLAAAVPPETDDPFTTHQEKVARETKLKELFSHFSAPVPDVLESVDRLHVMFHDDIRAIQMDNWYKGRVVLVGDAEHALSTLTGMGCSMALEDAWVLADELQRLKQGQDLAQVLASYQARRQPRIKHLQQLSDYFLSFIAVKNSFYSWFITTIAYHFIPDRFFTRSLERFAAQKI